MTTLVFPQWQPAYSAQWARQPLDVPHTLHLDPLFSLDSLADLVDRCPPAHYGLVHTSRGTDGQRRWREGDVNGMKGRDVIEAIKTGSMWLNLRDVGRVDGRYLARLESAYAELRAHVPGFDASALKLGILISSPLAQVPYHCDLPGQTLWQISGRKRVYVYPDKPPYLMPEAMENIAYSGFEFKLDYDPIFDRDATVIELEPGHMLSWPLNAPHRIDNHDCLNISITTEHWTPDNQRRQKLNLANAVLRNRLGIRPRSRATEGPSYWAKVGLQALWRRSPWAQQLQRAHRPIEFKLQAGAPGSMVDVKPNPQ